VAYALSDEIEIIDLRWLSRSVQQQELYRL